VCVCVLGKALTFSSMADLQDISGDSPMETDKFIDQGGYSKVTAG